MSSRLLVPRCAPFFPEWWNKENRPSLLSMAERPSRDRLPALRVVFRLAGTHEATQVVDNN
jgi:hypothetical protein